jgi:O-antigen biosynthesis protein
MDFTGEKFIPSDELASKEIGIEHLHRYHSIKNLTEGKIVLDIACGEGYGSMLIAQSAAEVFGVDLDNETIVHAKEKYKSKNLHFLQGTVENIPLSNHSIDIIISFETIEHVSETVQKKFIAEIKRVLKTSGTLVISTPNKINYSDRYSFANKFHIKEFDRHEFQSLMKSNFNYSNYYDQGYDIISAITETDPLQIRQIGICNWDRPLQSFSRKYLLAVASDEKIPELPVLTSVVFQVDRDYQLMMDRIVEMEAHILELGNWGRSLDEEVLQTKKQIKEDKLVIERQSANIEELSARHTKSNAELKALITQLADKSKYISELERLSIESKDRENELQKEIIKNGEILNTVEADFDQLRQISTRNLENISKKEKEIEGFISTIASLRNHVESLNEQIRGLEAKTMVKDRMINTVQDEIHMVSELFQTAEKEIVQKKVLLSNQSATIIQLKEKSNELGNEIKKLSLDVSDKTKIAEEANNKVNSLYQQVDILNDRIAEIYDSEGWKLLSKYYWVRNKVLPEKSKRHGYVKKFVNRLRRKKSGSNPQNFLIKRNTESPKKAEQLNRANPILEELKVYPPIEFPLFTSPKVSIIIPVFNGWEMTYRCLLAINENTQLVSYEIIIADDASDDETKNISNLIKNLKVSRNENNLGFLQNCNQAACLSKSEFVLFLNNDTEVKPGWLSSLVTLMEKDETIGIAGSKLIYPDGRLQEAGGIIWQDASGWNFGHLKDPGDSEFNYVKEVDYISGACILVRSDLWKKTGGFDTLYSPAYCEDSDLAFQARKYNYKVVYQPLSEVIHYEGYSHGTDKNSTEKNIKAYQKINNKKFHEKWKTILEAEHFPNGQDVFWAKDRSRNKKSILVIDHYVPQFDKDAGSRTTFQYLELFVSLNMNIKFLGDNFYRHEPYTTILQQMGIEVLYGPWYRDNWQQWMLENKEKFDFVYLNRPHISIKYIDFIKDNTLAKILYYGHDLHYLRELKQYEIEKDKQLLESSTKWKEIETYLFKNTNVILTPSSEEQLVIMNLDVNTNIKTIRPFFYEYLHRSITDFGKRKNILFVGGFNHKPNKDAVLWFIEEIWPSVKEEIPEIQFIIIGSNPPEEILNIGDDKIIIKGYVNDATLTEVYSQCRITVIPLRYGAGVKGKTVEAMHLGLPIVTTSFGIEGMPGDLSFLRPHNTAEDFARQLIELYKSDEELLELSKLEIEYIYANFSKTVAEKIMREILSII